ncbi:ligase-associated DNA damage response DEXH box helicase [Stenotrophomonas sp. SRS1]|uniref:ligase-associated DNA damage response DEXH box helicase n=1 Tax=Stenotrophomonas sp. SRS1 TaxID=2870345 RepID=UPI002237A330|nr:ligase-associated DNA damage response DEXH box helicase [Stenotrophomonas sp. SRS1]MCW6028430.1 ligase-associated DNA damage response DEXH box helicase [Stenotrophomonas sp. SRS1]
MARLTAWFASRGWAPLPFQKAMWRHYLAGESGLLHTPTGSGKTLAMFGGPLLQALNDPPPRTTRGRAKTPVPVLQVLWITPLRALAADTARALREPLDALGLDWQVGLRTGDASARDKRLAREGRLDVLVTTPESLALLLSYPDTMARLQHLRCVVVDEWHELLGNKRGVLLQLNLRRLRDALPALQVWGLSATLGNLDEAREVLLPDVPDAPLVAGVRPRPVSVETLLPAQGERFPWAGHLGLSQLQRVLEKLLTVRTSLLFTNTRAHAELWHQALSAVWPEDPDTLALHHGSLDPALRRAAEEGLREGRLRCVVATSSLDLGVDFPSVDQVLQIGSPKGIARLLQRAGRAKHRPGESGHIVCVPSHALELVEYAAARRALAQGHIEARRPLKLSLDVLAQHAVSCALGGGFEPEALFEQVRRTHAFAALDHAHWDGVLEFIVQGGRALSQYPDFHKVVRDDDGLYRVHDRRVALRHRLSIGTITSDGSVMVQFLRGGRLGAVEEQFLSRLRPGDRFQFAGRLLELVRLENLTAYVRVARGGDGVVPRWQGGRLPLSEALGHEMETVLASPPESPEMQWLAPLLSLQTRLSALPAPDRLLVEHVRRREGQFVFVYPFAGRQVNEGLAALMAMRWTRLQANTFGYAANDYGFVLAPARAVEIDAARVRTLLQPEGLLTDLRESLNLGELARRQFRDIARVSGMLVPALPGRTPRSLRQLQASSGLLYDVLRQHDPDHILLTLAEHEVLHDQLELGSLATTLSSCQARTLSLQHPTSLGPLSFPLWAERLRGQFSNEDWKTRVLRAAQQLEKRHGA